ARDERDLLVARVPVRANRIIGRHLDPDGELACLSGIAREDCKVGPGREAGRGHAHPFELGRLGLGRRRRRRDENRKTDQEHLLHDSPSWLGTRSYSAVPPDLPPSAGSLPLLTPASLPSSKASAVVATPSLATIRARCISTVLGLISRSRAMSLLEAPPSSP